MELGWLFDVKSPKRLWKYRKAAKVEKSENLDSL